MFPHITLMLSGLLGLYSGQCAEVQRRSLPSPKEHYAIQEIKFQLWMEALSAEAALSGTLKIFNLSEAFSGYSNYS